MAIERIHQESGRTFGARRVWARLREEGIEVARCTVERLMRQSGLLGASGAPGLRKDGPLPAVTPTHCVGSADSDQVVGLPDRARHPSRKQKAS